MRTINFNTDDYLDNIARRLRVNAAYKTKDGGIFYVVKVDRGEKFAQGRRPAQAKVIILSDDFSLNLKEGAVKWLTGRELEWIAAKPIA